MKRQIFLFMVGALGIFPVIGADGEKAFEYDFGRPLQTAPAVDNDGTIYIGGSGAVAAVTPSGSELWKRELSEGSEAKVNSITIGENRIFVTSGEGLFAFSKRGLKAWTNQIDTSSSAVAVGLDGNIFVGTQEGGQLYSFTPEGNLRWNHPVETGGLYNTMAAPAVGLDGKIYIRSGEEFLTAFDNSGQEEWSESVTYGRPHPPAFLDTGEILVLEGAGFFNVVGTNGIVTSTTETIPYFEVSPVVGPDGQIYVIPPISYWGEFTTLNTEGEVAWNSAIVGNASPVVAGDGTVVVAGGGKITAFAPIGAVKWTYTNNATVVQGLSIGADHTILAAEATGRLLGLHGSSPLASRGWPTYGGDAKHTFNKRTPVLISDVTVSNVTDTSATFSVEINPAGRAADLYFEVSTAGTVAKSAPQPIPAGNEPVEIVVNTTNLAPGNLYAVQAISSNTLEVVTSAATHFQTLGELGAVPPTFQALQALATTGGTLVFSEGGLIEISSPIEFTTDAEIDGNGHAVVLSGTGETSLLKLAEGVGLTMKGLTLIKGKAQGYFAADGGMEGNGGAILNQGGDLTIMGCTFSNNIAAGARVKLQFGGSRTYPLPHGGSSDLPANAAGGAIWQEGGTLLILDSTFTSNRVDGGIGYNTPQVGMAKGGAVYLKDVAAQITGSTISGNHIAAPSMGITFPRPGTAEGGGLFMTGGTLLMERSELRGNVSSYGELALGGGLAQRGGSLVLTNSIVAGNTAIGTNGGGRDMDPGEPALGGGFYADGSASVFGSSFLTNTTLGGLGQYSGSGESAGGGIYNTGELTIENSTFARNAALTGWYDFRNQAVYVAGTGSAIFNAGSAGLTNTTIAGNLEAEIAVTGTGPVILKNSLVAWNEGQNLGTNVVDEGHNLSSDATPGLTEPSSLNNADPKLGLLGYYGGFTPVFPILGGSPAINAADDSAAPETDQRGRERPHGAAADIGAFESSPPFYVWGSINGPHDSSTELAFGTNMVVPDVSGDFDLGPLPKGITEIAITATNTLFRPNPWPLDVSADGPVDGLFAFEVHSFAYDQGFEEPVFTLAGEEGETYQIDGSTDLENWSPVGTYTVDASGLISIQITNSAKLFLRPALLQQ